MAADTQDKTSDGASYGSVHGAQARTGGSRSTRRRRGAAIRTAPPVADLDDVQKPVSTHGDAGTTADEEDVVARLHDRFAELIETIEVQTAIVALIGFDLVSTIVSLLVRSHYEILRLDALVEISSSKKSVGPTSVADVQPSLVVAVLLRLLESLAGFTIVFFAVELAVLGFTFRRRFFQHVGYVADLLVVVSSIGLEVYTESNVARLLGLLRVWRVFRLVETLLEREKKRHEITTIALETEQTRVLQLLYEKQAAEQSLERELESREGIERMLRGYKYEADTLREALTIAAQAVAEATMPVATFRSEEAATEGKEVVYHDWEIDAAFANDFIADVDAPSLEGVEEEHIPTQVYSGKQDGDEAVASAKRAEENAARREDGQESEEDDDAEFVDAQTSDG